MILPNSNRCPSPVDMIGFKHLSSPDVKIDVNLNFVSTPATTVKLTWKDLSYRVPCSPKEGNAICDDKSTTSSSSSLSSWVSSSIPCLRSKGVNQDNFKEILKPQSGHVTGGTLTALMGPSGAGKSTLLNCITNRIQDGVSGEVWVKVPQPGRKLSRSSASSSLSSSSSNSSINSSSSSSSSSSVVRQVRIAFVPQLDHLFSQFTVRESLLFASRLNNADLSRGEHDNKVTAILANLDLDRCADLKVSQLSGGQVKRVSIGVELISNPEILILDEPTSGLDSDNSENVVRLLKNLTENADHAMESPPAIISTIHQPSFEVFSMFTNIYLLNKYGENIYFGSPRNMISFLCSFGFREPSNVNPADYAIEIANGRFGTKQFESMIVESRTTFAAETLNAEYRREAVRIEELKQREATGFFFQFYLLFMRSIQAYLFKSPQTIIKMLMNILIAALVCSMWAEPLGPEDGCWSNNLDMRNASSETEALKNSLFEAAASESAREQYLERLSKITGNVNFFFMSGLYFIIVYTVGTVLIMPLEMRTVTKELSNSWYRVSAYFTAKTSCDVLLLLLTAVGACVYKYYMTEQIMIPWRFLAWLGIVMLFCEVCESKGVLIGVVFNFDSIVATIVATTSIFPDVIFSGFMIKIAQIPLHYRFMTMLSHLRYSFEATLLSIYGFGRCHGGEVVKEFVDDLTTAGQKSPLSVITSIWTGLNITSADTRRFAVLLGLQEEQLEPVVTAVSDYLGTSHSGDASDYNETTTIFPDSATSSDPQYEASYVLSYFNIHDHELVYDVLVLFIMVFVLRAATYIALQYKTQRQRL